MIMEQKAIDISVITPFYKGNAHMEQLFGCIRRNALSAPHLAIELILVNDSPDCPIQYHSHWVEGFSLQIYSNPVNVGIQHSRVNGLNQAQGTFVVFLDQDDLLTDTALCSQYQHSHNADIVVCNGYNENRSKTKPIYHSLAHHRQVSSLRFYLSVGCLIVSPGQCLIRRSAIPQLWKKTFIGRNGADDYFLWLLLLQQNCRWEVNPDILYTHINTGENLSIDLERMLLSSCEVLDILLKHGLPPKMDAIARRRFDMRRIYEGREAWRKALACICYPDLFLELFQYTFLKMFCP